MKAISIKQPWASFIAAGIKDIENRTWKTNFRGRVYIHASAKVLKNSDLNLLVLNLVITEAQYKSVPFNLFFKYNYPYSAIIGEVDIIDCVRNHPSIWAEKDCYNWVLANATIYDQPILNIKGALSFWEFNPDKKNKLINFFKNFRL